MLTCTFIFLGVAGFIVAISLFLSTTRQVAAFDTRMPWKEEDIPKWDRRANWHEIKTAWIVWYARCQEGGALERQKMRSWARTFALCAALCLVGVMLEIHFNDSITLPRILAGFGWPRPAASAFHSPQSGPHKVNTISSTN
jgi:hypothetical protein